MPKPPAVPTPARRPTHPNWGGRRPRAGAPKGNLNHFKHGFDSHTITLAALIIQTFPEVHRLFHAIVTTTDKARYRRLLASDRANTHGAIPLQDSIKSDIALAVLHRLAQIQKAEELSTLLSGQSRQSSPAKRFYESVKRTHPHLYAQWFPASLDGPLPQATAGRDGRSVS